MVSVYSGSITVDKSLNCQKIPDGWETDCSLNAFKNCSLAMYTSISWELEMIDLVYLVQLLVLNSRHEFGIWPFILSADCRLSRCRVQVQILG
jgi:hypothetical protein